VDHYTRSWYEMRFESDFVGFGGTEFQRLFTRVMELRHPDDFVQVKPWGDQGDRKCDGFLSSDERLFQVYGPEDLKKARAEAKMQEDFDGALSHWPGRFRHWTFVHNSRGGVPPFVLAKLQALQALSPGVTCSQWGYAELRARLFALAQPEIALILGSAPSSADIQGVRYTDIAAILAFVSAGDAPPTADLRPVSVEKLQSNQLSPEVVGFLRLGLQRAPHVARYFSTHHDPRYGDAIAASFRGRYDELTRLGYAGDELFWELERFAGGRHAGSPREASAALAVLAHLFEQCDIYERPGSESKGNPL
jgi:hypothetical protein